MKLTQKDIEEFKAIYRKNFGQELSDKEAYEESSSLLRLIDLIYQPSSINSNNKENEPSCN